jgi:hypothetical protein
MPKKGKVTMGKNAVTGTGTASVAHHTAIQIPTPATRHAVGSMAVCE